MEHLVYQVIKIVRRDMKKVFIIFVLFVIGFHLTGCENSEEELINQFITVEADDEEKIVINTETINSVATFVNYEVDGVIIQFIVVRGTDGKVRIAFNTCQACNPSSNAYFIQKGECLECQNCKNKFHIDKIGEEQGGCNQTPVEEKEETDNQIIISQKYADSYREKFENWNGPIQ